MRTKEELLNQFNAFMTEKSSAMVACGIKQKEIDRIVLPLQHAKYHDILNMYKWMQQHMELPLLRFTSVLNTRTPGQWRLLEQVNRNIPDIRILGDHKITVRKIWRKRPWKKFKKS